MIRIFVLLVLGIAQVSAVKGQVIKLNRDKLLCDEVHIGYLVSDDDSSETMYRVMDITGKVKLKARLQSYQGDLSQPFYWLRVEHPDLNMVTELPVDFVRVIYEPRLAIAQMLGIKHQLFNQSGFMDEAIGSLFATKRMLLSKKFENELIREQEIKQAKRAMLDACMPELLMDNRTICSKKLNETIGYIRTIYESSYSAKIHVLDLDYKVVAYAQITPNADDNKLMTYRKENLYLSYNLSEYLENRNKVLNAIVEILVENGYTLQHQIINDKVTNIALLDNIYIDP